MSGSLAHVGGAHGVDLAGFALGQVLVLSKEVHCRSLSSIHILYNHTTTARLKPNPEPWYGFTYFHCPEVVHVNTPRHMATLTLCTGYRYYPTERARGCASRWRTRTHTHTQTRRHTVRTHKHTQRLPSVFEVRTSNALARRRDAHATPRPLVCRSWAHCNTAPRDPADHLGAEVRIRVRVTSRIRVRARVRVRVRVKLRVKARVRVRVRVRVSDSGCPHRALIPAPRRSAPPRRAAAPRRARHRTSRTWCSHPSLATRPGRVCPAPPVSRPAPVA